MEEIHLLGEIGKRLKACRKKRRLTQAQLSYACQTDPSYIRKIEAGKVNISVVRLASILAALDMSLHEFLCDL
ncbi:MAG: helix-turn-helix transcriptional regulator [Lewinellaceae bacterium]|nr:helix-turn-helix transcriptional regulator [Lewinellaceae bacterium]